jgi:hypothetical protein
MTALFTTIALWCGNFGPSDSRNALIAKCRSAMLTCVKIDDKFNYKEADVHKCFKDKVAP